MGTFRRPKGSYVRTTADFYLQDSASAGAIITVTSPPVPALDLFNNATDGTLLHVYEVIIGAQGYGPYAITPVFGHGANLIGPALPIVIGEGQPFGQLYWDALTAAQTWTSGVPVEGLNYNSAYAIDATGSTVDPFRTSGPVAVIPPGYSLRVWYPINFGTGTKGTLSASFRFVELHDRG